MCTTSRRQAGFTLIELIFFIVVVSVGIAGILMVMDVSVKSSADPMVRKQSMALADSLLEEILLKAYNDPDGLPNVVESGRSTYDDVSDYDGINETVSATGPIFLGLPPNLYGFNIQIAVPPPTTLGGMAAKKVTVTITKGTDSITMTGYRTNY